METLKNSTETSDKLGLQIRNILADGKLTQDMDEEEITALGELFTSEETQAYSATKELLKETLVASLEKGISVHGEAQKDFLQKVVTLAGLDFDVNAIYETNRDFLTSRTQTRRGMVETSPEQKTYIFKYSPNHNGAFLVYEYDDGTGIFNMQEADMIGYIPTGSLVIRGKNGRDDFLDDNNSFKIAGTSREQGEKILTDRLREDALREQAIRAQLEAQQAAERQQEAQKEAERKAEEAKAMLENQKQQYEIQIQGLHDEIGKLTENLSALSQTNTTKESEIQSLKDQVTQLSQKISTLQEMIQSRPQDTETITPEINAIQSQIASCHVRIGELHAHPESLSFGNISSESSSPPFPYFMGENVFGKEDSSSSSPKMEESPQEEQDSFSLNNPIKFWEIGNEHLSTISLQSKEDLISLLEKYKGQTFPKTHFEASEYALAFQCAISYLDSTNSMGNIDGHWGKKSAQALKQVQKNILGFSESSSDGKPGPKTLSALLEKISQK